MREKIPDFLRWSWNDLRGYHPTYSYQGTWIVNILAILGGFLIGALVVGGTLMLLTTSMPFILMFGAMGALVGGFLGIMTAYAWRYF